MALYLVGYDLMNHKTQGEYEELMKELKRLGAQKVLLSQWVLQSNVDAEAIRDRLRKFMHEDDRMLVAEITNNWASCWTLFSINEL